MSDDDITLPPLPPAEWLGYDPEGGNLHGHSFDAMREFARAAVLLDRQQRAAPSAEPVDHTALLRQALEALEERYIGALRDNAIDALRAALEEKR